MENLSTAIDGLILEFDVLDGTNSLPAAGRRTLAMERVSAAMFDAINTEMDPYGIDDLNEVVAAESLRFALFLSDSFARTVLDFRAILGRHGYRPEAHGPRLRSLLLGMWDDALEEMWTLADEDLPGAETEGPDMA